ncbi:MAG: CBS domain-containing protein [Candidatus Lambdaproteobacteria bacterium]|nr:CBS domain-containing protein [Candidatus Lambdaproteobacteria bacterium]
MNVEHWMKRKLHAIAANDNLMRAWRLMMAYNIRHLPVLDEAGQLVGILSDRDIKKHALPLESRETILARQEHLESIRVGSVMIRNVITIAPEAPMQDAAFLLKKHRIDCLPVLRDKRLEGMVTTTDFLDYFAQTQGQPAE